MIGDVFVHASCVALDGNGVLLRGPSGSGKSNLALRLIDGGAVLVADDQVALTVEGEKILASAPPALSGLLEVRGVGIVQCEVVPTATVRLVIDLDADAEIERLPEPATCDLLGLAIPRYTLDPFEASAAAKVRLALRNCLLAG